MTEQHGILEVDEGRGVIYFHADKTGTTKLRICGLKIPKDWSTIDIHGFPEQTTIIRGQRFKSLSAPRRKP